MPKVAKLTTREPVAPQTGILARAVPAKAIGSKHVKVVIYGTNRTGKTTLACGWRDKNGKYVEGSGFPRPLLLLDCEPGAEGGALSIAGLDGVSVLRITSVGELSQAASELTKSNPYKTVVVDSATAVQDLVLKDLLGVDALPDQMSFGAVTSQQYRDRSEITRNQLRPFVDLPCFVVFTAKEKDHNPPKEERVTASGKSSPDMRPRFLRGMQLGSWVAPELGSSTAGWLCDVCTLVGRLYLDKEVLRETGTVAGQKVTTESETGKFVRCLRTAYHPNFAAGLRSSSPHSVPECIEEPTFDKIWQIVKPMMG